MSEVTRSMALFLPEIALTLGLMLVVLVDATGARWRNGLNRALTALSLVAALVLLRGPARSGASAEIWSGMVVVDPLGAFFKVVLLLASLVIVLAFTFRNSRELRGLGQGEFYALMLAVTFSNLLLASSNDLAMLYLALEMVSITSYVMVAYLKGDRLSNEASLKYILFGAVSTGAMLYGLSLLYGLTGSTSLPVIREVLASVKLAFAAAMSKLPTPKLTRALQSAVQRQAPPRAGLIRPKLRYAHQGGSNPPLIVIHGTALDTIPDMFRTAANLTGAMTLVAVLPGERR